MKLFTKFIIFLTISLGSFSQDINSRKREFLTDKGLAISGYDPVSYFAKNPQKGRKEFNYTFEGIKYQFINATNQMLFSQNPTKYEPQYGGWCAYAMGAKGEKVEVDPETYKIVNGKLHLFYHSFFSNTLNDWNKDEKILKNKADINWDKIISQSK